MAFNDEPNRVPQPGRVPYDTALPGSSPSARHYPRNSPSLPEWNRFPDDHPALKYGVPTVRPGEAYVPTDEDRGLIAALAAQNRRQNSANSDTQNKGGRHARVAFINDQGQRIGLDGNVLPAPTLTNSIGPTSYTFPDSFTKRRS